MLLISESLKNAGKRCGSPTEVPGPKRKQVKIAPKITPNIIKHAWNTANSNISFNSSIHSNHTVTRLDLTDSSQVSLARSQSDSGVDMRSASDLSSSSCSNSQEQPLAESAESSTLSQGLPIPKMYTQRRKGRKEKLQKRNIEDSSSEKKRNRSPQDMGTPVHYEEMSAQESGIGSVLLSLDRGVTSPLHAMLRTPPKSGTKSRLTSTPTKSDEYSSPLWISPIRGFTPLSADGHLLDSGIFTPLRESGLATSTPNREDEEGASPKLNTPMRAYASPHLRVYNEKSPSPRAGSLRDLGLPGLTPLKLTPNSPNIGFGVNQSFAKLFGDIQLDSMLDEGMPIDVANISFSAFQ